MYFRICDWHMHVIHSRTLFRVLFYYYYYFTLSLTSLLTHLKSHQDGVCLYQRYDNHSMCLTEISHHRHSRMTARSHYSGNGSTSFCELPFISREFDKGPSTTNLKIFGLTRSGIELGTFQTLNECSTTRLPVLQCTCSRCYFVRPRLIFRLISVTKHRIFTVRRFKNVGMPPNKIIRKWSKNRVFWELTF